MSVPVAIGVDDTGHREVVGVAEGMKEDRASRGSSSVCCVKFGRAV